jgi:hypothetical protein
MITLEKYVPIIGSLEVSNAFINHPLAEQRMRRWPSNFFSPSMPYIIVISDSSGLSY